MANIIKEKTNESSQNVIAVLFGLGSILVDPKTLLLTSARLINSGLQRRFLRQMDSEFEMLRQQTGVRDDAFADKNVESIYSSILKELEENNDELERLNLMKKLFFLSLGKDTDISMSILLHQLVQKAKKLNTMDIILLFKVFEMYESEKPEYKNISDIGEWRRVVFLEFGGYEAMDALLLESEKNLTEMGLLIEGKGLDRVKLYPNESKFRLKDLGYLMCKYALDQK